MTCALYTSVSWGSCAPLNELRNIIYVYACNVMQTVIAQTQKHLERRRAGEKKWFNKRRIQKENISKSHLFCSRSVFGGMQNENRVTAAERHRHRERHWLVADESEVDILDPQMWFHSFTLKKYPSWNFKSVKNQISSVWLIFFVLQQAHSKAVCFDKTDVYIHLNIVQITKNAVYPSSFTLCVFFGCLGARDLTCRWLWRTAWLP